MKSKTKRREERALTEREIQVLGMLARGFGTKAIANALEIGERTVDWHLMNARSALAAESRTQAVATAIGRGFISVASGDGGQQGAENGAAEGPLGLAI